MRKLRKATGHTSAGATANTITLVAGVATVLWGDPDLPPGATAVQIELEYAPHFVIPVLITPAGTWSGAVQVSSITVTGCTLTSRMIGSNPLTTETGDTSVYRVYAFCRAEDIGGLPH